MRHPDAAADNAYALMRAMATTLPGAELQVGARVVTHHASPFNPMFKGVWGIRAETTDADVTAALDWLAERGAPFAFVWGDGRAPADLPRRLSALGLDVFEQDAPALAADLDALDWDAAARAPAGLEIAVARDADDLGAFADVFVRSFGVPAWAAQAWADATDALGARAPWSILVGRLDGEPVAGTIVFNDGGGTCGQYGLGTVSDARGRGIGTAITLAGFDLGRAAGERLAVLFATDEGLGMYRRLGLEPSGTTVSRWLWRAT